MTNIIIECEATKNNVEYEDLVFYSDSEMEEFFIYNINYKVVKARKIVLLQKYNKDKKEFEWI